MLTRYKEIIHISYINSHFIAYYTIHSRWDFFGTRFYVELHILFKTAFDMTRSPIAYFVILRIFLNCELTRNKIDLENTIFIPEIEEKLSFRFM